MMAWGNGAAAESQNMLVGRVSVRKAMNEWLQKRVLGMMVWTVVDTQTEAVVATGVLWSQDARVNVTPGEQTVEVNVQLNHGARMVVMLHGRTVGVMLIVMLLWIHDGRVQETTGG